ncbi:hypothetical protein VTJ49DRAFT_5249 [Mycothermus thermophilus]|uniref:Uncharacterized protein n=1 Tax=Humicola insolens TaxID=85995 RepID=A0ABR3V447_HUMIN
MEGAQTPNKLTPYFHPNIPWGTSGRRLHRHDFLSNRWGLQHYYATPPLGLGESGVRLHATVQKALQTAAVLSAEAAQAALDKSFLVLRNEVHDVRSRIRHVEQATERVAQKLDAVLKQTAGTTHTQGMDEAERVVQKLDAMLSQLATTSRTQGTEEGERDSLLRQYRKEVERWSAEYEGQRAECDRLRSENESVKKELAQAKQTLHIATLQAITDGEELQERQHRIEQLTREKAVVMAADEQLPNEELLMWGFRQLREGVMAFAKEVADHSGPLPRSLEVADSLFDPACWNRVGKQQRMYRVMAKVFHVLFRRILRPGLKAFGLQTFLRTKEHHAISAVESNLRTLEREMESQGVPPEVINKWVNTTIATIKPLRDVRQNVEGVTQEILEALDPLVKHRFIRNVSQAREKISAICENAVNFKLNLRQHGGKYKVEVPSRDVKRWGEAGCDDDTKAFQPTRWLRVVDHEVVPSTTEDKQAGSGDLKGISVIVFGALTKVEDGIYDEDIEKVFLELGWVVLKRSAEYKAQKRKSPNPEEMEVEEARRTAVTNTGVSQRQIARIKALMGQDS